LDPRSVPKEGKVKLTRDYPMLVRFRDLTNPKTVERLCYTVHPCDANPEALSRTRALGLEEAFGKGVRINEVTIEMTHEPVTWGEVDKLLPWFKARRQAKTKGPIGGTPEKPFEDPTGTWLTSKDFARGER
jgi:hypothetical protein